MLGEQKGSDIVVLEPNTAGDDYVIGDVHGNPCLREVFNLLGENDRLLIVGDLTDRGKDSIGVIELVIQHQDKIFVSRGNHENFCLQTIAILEECILKDPQAVGFINTLIANWEQTKDITPIREAIQKNPEMEMLFLHALYNGGEWLVSLFANELEEKKITIENRDGQKTIVYRDNSKIKMIREYMEKLPYIIHVEGDKPYNVVHADFPLSDRELQKRIKEGRGLSDSERHYITWAREKGGDVLIRNKRRTSHSLPTFTGHTPLEIAGTSPVREKTNTYNIDVHNSGVSLVINLTKGSSQFIGAGKAKLSDVIIAAKTKIDTQLYIWNNLTAFLQAMRECETLKDYERALLTWSKEKAFNLEGFNLDEGVIFYYFSRKNLIRYAHHHQAVSKETHKKLIENPALRKLLSFNTFKRTPDTPDKVLPSNLCRSPKFR